MVLFPGYSPSYWSAIMRAFQGKASPATNIYRPLGRGDFDIYFFPWETIFQEPTVLKFLLLQLVPDEVTLQLIRWLDVFFSSWLNSYIRNITVPLRFNTVNNFSKTCLINYQFLRFCSCFGELFLHSRSALIDPGEQAGGWSACNQLSVPDKQLYTSTVKNISKFKQIAF